MHQEGLKHIEDAKNIPKLIFVPSLTFNLYNHQSPYATRPHGGQLVFELVTAQLNRIELEVRVGIWLVHKTPHHNIIPHHPTETFMSPTDSTVFLNGFLFCEAPCF